MTSDLREKLLKLLSDCPFGHYDGRVVLHRSTTEADLIAWIDRLYEVKDELRAEGTP